MKNESNKQKRQGKLRQSGISADTFSARSMFRVGQPAIYIEPKNLSDSESESHQSLTRKICNQNDKSNGQFISQHKLAEWGQKNKQGSFFGNSTPTIIKYVKINNWKLTILQGIIFCTFILGSLWNPIQFKYLDLIGNVICLLKIILLHTYIIFYNSKRQQQLQNQQKNNKNQQQYLTLYINKLQLYQLFQIWSIICTFLIFLFNNQALQVILYSARLVRLFFPFLCIRRKQNKWRAHVFGHVLKITVMIGVVIIGMGVCMQLLLNNIDNYYCISVEQLGYFTYGIFPQSRPNTCGISNTCSNNFECRNIYSFSQDQHKFDQIQSYLGYQALSFSRNFIVTLWNIFNAGSATYQYYSPYIQSWLIFPISVLIWLIIYILIGIGIGQAIRYQSIQNWKRMISKNQLSNKNKDKKRRHSNIAYIASQTRMIIPTNTQIKNQTQQQFSYQINQIQKYLSGRSIIQKIATVVFNLFCVAHVCLIISDNLNLQQITNRNVGIALGVIFILWTFGLAFALYEQFSQSQKQSIGNNQIYILIFEVLAYVLTLADYIMRAADHKLIFEQPSYITPFSHAAISLRILFVLYNNGFDSYISYYTQKMLQNFLRKAQLIGFMLVLSVMVALLECYVLQKYALQQQIQLINSRISTIFGIGNSRISHSEIGNAILVSVKFMSVLTLIYIAKHINLSYDLIFQIDFSQTSLQLPQPNSTYHTINKIRKLLINVHRIDYYIKLKAIIISVYSVLSILFQDGDNTIQLILFIIDIYLVIDIATQVIGVGIIQYTSIDCPIRYAYIISQVFLCIVYFVDIPLCLVSSLHISRIFILFGCMPQLYNIYKLIKTILIHPKLKIYRIIILTIPLILMAMGLISLYTTQLQNQHKIINTIAYSISFIYGLNCNFISHPSYNSSNLSSNSSNFTIISNLSLNIIFVSVNLFLHIILTFMMVTYFVNRNNNNNGQTYNQILRSYVNSQPTFYFHQPTTNYAIYDYLKVLKVAIIFVSFVLIAILSGNFIIYSEIRQYLAITNLILCFIQILIYLLENIFVKSESTRWNYFQPILLALSLPGTFFLIVPVAKYSVGIICLICSILRILRIFPLLANRRISILSSKILRRISKQLYLWETCAIFIFIIVCILPFSMFYANYAQSSFQVQFLNFLTGSLFTKKDISIIQLIVKFLCTVLVIFPLRIMLIARVISSFLNNKPNQLFVLRDQISQVIADQGLLDKQQQIVFLSYSEIYRFTAQIHRIFDSFGKKANIKCVSYNQILTKLTKLNIPVYVKQQQENHCYGIFVFDVIWYLFQLYKVKTVPQDQYLDSLYQKITPKLQNVKRSHIGTTQLSAYLKIKQKIKRIMKKHQQKMSRN